MPDDVRCPGCDHARAAHFPDRNGYKNAGCYEWGCECTLTPAEIDAVLAMRDGAAAK